MKEKPDDIKLHEKGADDQEQGKELPVNIHGAKYTVQKQEYFAEQQEGPYLSAFGLGADHRDGYAPAQGQQIHSHVNGQYSGHRTDAPEGLLQELIDGRIQEQRQNAHQDQVQGHG